MRKRSVGEGFLLGLMGLTGWVCGAAGAVWLMGWRHALGAFLLMAGASWFRAAVSLAGGKQ